MTDVTQFEKLKSPWPAFEAWFHEAETSEPNDPNAFALATADADGKTSVRVVLMKDMSETGITFYTNRESIKGRALAANPYAAANFHWKSLRRQVRLQGPTRPVEDAVSDAYFATRPRGSQIGAWASHQSRPLATREAFEQAVAGVEARFEGKEVPRPPHWGGYLLSPERFEFWEDRDFRMHVRWVFEKTADGWSSPFLVNP
ncbi:MAG: pyridoxamine 5'-phosphate oxidase [Pseudomonadota bacterium]